MRTVLAIAMGLMLATSPVRAQDPITVAAAVSLKEAIAQVARAYEAETGTKFTLTFGSSGQLMNQVRSGAAVDVFISAAQKQIDQLADDNLLLAGSECIVAGNTLALIVPADSDVNLDGFSDLADPRVRWVALGQPDTVPAGQYAMQTLQALKLDVALEGRLIYGSSVRQVLDYVRRGEVTAGLVYATDARLAAERVRVVATADPKWHDPIVYPAAIVASSRQPAAARAFLKFLLGESAQATLTAHGFAHATIHE